MAILPANLTRVSNTLRANVVSQTITRTQAQLLAVQNELATGKRLSVPSDDPGDAAIAQQLRKTLEQREAYAANLKAANRTFSEVDSTLADLTDLLQQAQQIASANVGSDVTADARKAAAAVVDSIYNQALLLANKQLDGVYLFGGDRSTTAPFVDAIGGVQFVGSSRVLNNRLDESSLSAFMIDGQMLFGSASNQVMGSADLTPTLTTATRLADLRGGRSMGVQLGSITLNNGTVQQTIDLSSAKSVGDVINLINNAAVGVITASLSADGNSITLTPGAAETLSVMEVGGGTTAADLGILQATALGAGVPLDGQNLKANLTPLTPIASLNNGAGIDGTGFTISNGGAVANIDLSSVVTVEDLLNQINGAGAGVRAEINSAGTGINIINVTQGTDLRISENGGTSAADLGVRSLTTATSLSQLNGGKGVRTAAGDDFQITRSDGSVFTVDIEGATTVGDVIAAINAADGGGGLTASFSTTGNGIVLTDTAGGPGQPALSPLNYSFAAEDLGLLKAPVGNTITGSDVNPIRSQGIFANLAQLRDALNASDQTRITEAAEGLKADHERVTITRGHTGAKVQEVESRQNRLEDQNLATMALLSELEDSNYTDAITRYQTLQNMLQASLRVGAAQLNLSLLDFLG
jgi:flagellar hook-associated protein 3 FlgL